MVNPFPKRRFGGSPLGDDVPPDLRWDEPISYDESEGERMARRHYEQPMKSSSHFVHHGRGGGKTAACQEMIARHVKQKRGEGKHVNIGIAIGGNVHVVPSDATVDCIVLTLHQETQLAYFVTIEYEYEGRSGKFERIWIPKSVSFVTGDHMRVPAWLLVSRERDLLVGNAIADNLLKGYKPPR